MDSTGIRSELADTCVTSALENDENLCDARWSSPCSRPSPCLRWCWRRASSTDPPQVVSGAPAPARCAVSRLSAVGSWQGATNSMRGSVALTNVAAQACSLAGYPSITLTSGQATALPVEIRRALVDLAPGSGRAPLGCNPPGRPCKRRRGGAPMVELVRQGSRSPHRQDRLLHGWRVTVVRSAPWDLTGRPGLSARRLQRGLVHAGRPGVRRSGGGRDDPPRVASRHRSPPWAGSQASSPGASPFRVMRTTSSRALRGARGTARRRSESARGDMTTAPGLRTGGGDPLSGNRDPVSASRGSIHQTRGTAERSTWAHIRRRPAWRASRVQHRPNRTRSPIRRP